MLKFDLNQNPPMAEEIEAEKNRLVAERKKLKIQRIGAFILAAVVVFALMLAVIATFGDVPELRAVTAMMNTGLAISLVLVFRVIAGCFFEDKLLFCEKRIAGAQTLPVEQAPPVVEACQADPLCDSYRLKVAGQGRSLLVDEGDMIRSWVANADRRAAQVERDRQAKSAADRLTAREPLTGEVGQQRPA